MAGDLGGLLDKTKQAMSQNLGQVSAVHVGTTAPTNTRLIWAKTTTNDPQTWQIISFFIYDAANTTWKDLDVSSISMTRLVEWKVISDPTYDFLDEDLGKVLLFTNAAGVTANVPAGLMDNWQCVGIYTGTGIMTFTKEAGVTLNAKNGGMTLQEQNDPFWLTHRTGNECYLLGDLV